MQREIIDKANEIIRIIENNERAVTELKKYEKKGTLLYADRYNVCSASEIIPLEAWEIRLMIHNKKQRIAALKQQLERL